LDGEYKRRESVLLIQAVEKGGRTLMTGADIERGLRGGKKTGGRARLKDAGLVREPRAKSPFETRKGSVRRGGGQIGITSRGVKGG